MYVILSSMMFIVLYSLIYPGTDWPPYVVWLIAWSFTTFVVYGVDKLTAGAEALRAPKLILHLLALAGGVFGAWPGMLVWRHKTRQADFLAVLVVATVLHLSLIYYFFLMPR